MTPTAREAPDDHSPGSGAGAPDSPGRRFTVFLAAVSALGAGLVLARQAAYGPGLLWDSVNYLAVARNLLAGEGFLNFDGTPYTVWPPLYPLLLAAAGLAGGADPLRVAGLLGALGFGLTVFVVGRYLAPRLASPLLRVWTPLFLALSLPLADLSRYALAGPVFVLFLTLALVATDSYLAAPRLSGLLRAALWTALAWQTRYIGAALPLVIGLWLLLHRGLPLRTRLGRAALFTAIVGAPTGLWVLRNTVLVGRFTGHPPPLAFDGGRTLSELFDGFRAWAAFDLLSPLLPLALGVAILLPVAAGLLAGSAAPPPAGADSGSGDEWRSAALCGSFALGYLILLTLATSMNEIWINDRYLAPVFVPLLAAGALSLDRFLRRERTRARLGTLRAALPGPAARGLGAGAGRAPTLLTALVGAGLCLWAAGQVAPTAEAVARANSEQVGGGFHGPPWTGFETLRYLREEAAPEGTIFHSNLPILVYLHTAIHTGGRGTYRSLPPTADTTHRIVGPAWVPGLAPEERLARWLPEVPEGSLVVWLRDDPATTARFYSYGRPGLTALPELLPVAEFVDGAVFRVTRGSDRETPDRYTAAFAAISSGEAGAPAARSTFDLYLGGRTLTYHRAPCREEEVAANFFLHLYPPEGTPPRRGRTGFDNLDFRFAELGVRRGDRCVAVVPLPPREFARLRTGQWVPGAGESWSVELPARTPQ